MNLKKRKKSKILEINMKTFMGEKNRTGLKSEAKLLANNTQSEVMQNISVF
jgi:hypothetical protein